MENIAAVKLILSPLGRVRGPGGPESGVNVLCSHARPYGWRRDNKMVGTCPDLSRSLSPGRAVFPGRVGGVLCLSVSSVRENSEVVKF